MAQDENDSIAIPSAYKKFKVKARYGDPIGLTVDQFFQFTSLTLASGKLYGITISGLHLKLLIGLMEIAIESFSSCAIIQFRNILRFLNCL